MHLRPLRGILCLVQNQELIYGPPCTIQGARDPAATTNLFEAIPYKGRQCLRMARTRCFAGEKELAVGRRLRYLNKDLVIELLWSEKCKCT